MPRVFDEVRGWIWVDEPDQATPQPVPPAETYNQNPWHQQYTIPEQNLIYTANTTVTHRQGWEARYTEPMAYTEQGGFTYTRSQAQVELERQERENAYNRVMHERYQQLEEQYRRAAEQQIIFGTGYGVAVEPKPKMKTINSKWPGYLV